MVKLKKLKLSFKYAFDGLKVVFKEEQSFRIQLVIAGLVTILMCYLPLRTVERAVLFLTIAFVLGFELLNSQLERVLDFLEPNHDPRVRRIKDISAGAVFVAMLGSVLVGLFIFIPYLL